jgi:mannose-6-phosphate isomerase-like protein (cupin superfamily)
MSDRSTEMTLPAGGPSHGARVRAHHDVVLRVLDGVVVLLADDDELVLTPYDEVTIPAGTPHHYWNAGDEDARVVATPVWRWRAASRLLTVRHRPPEPAAMVQPEVSEPAPGLVRRRAPARIATV